MFVGWNFVANILFEDLCACRRWVESDIFATMHCTCTSEYRKEMEQCTDECNIDGNAEDGNKITHATLTYKELPYIIVSFYCADLQHGQGHVWNSSADTWKWLTFSTWNTHNGFHGGVWPSWAWPHLVSDRCHCRMCVDLNGLGILWNNSVVTCSMGLTLEHT